jgi:hypothetical protein
MSAQRNHRIEMDDHSWKLFLQTSRQVLGKGQSLAWASQSWCAWTTFSMLEDCLTYWACGLPEEDELLPSSTQDGGLWRQSFHYSDLAHIIIPARFSWERCIDQVFHSGTKAQDIARLSRELKALNIPHRTTDLVLEIKLF